MGVTAPRRFRKLAVSGLVTLMASTSLLILDMPTASAAVPIVVNSGNSPGTGNLPNWIEGTAITRNSRGGASQFDDDIFGTLLVKHDETTTVSGVAIDSDWGTTDETASLAPTGATITTIPGVSGGSGSTFSTVRFQVEPPNHPDARTDPILGFCGGSNSRPSGPFRVRAVLSDGQRTAPLTVTIRQMMEVGCTTTEYAHIYGQVQSATTVAPGATVNFTFQGDDPDSLFGNDAFDKYRWRVRRLNDGAIVQGPNCVDRSGSNSDNVVITQPVTFAASAGRGRYVVETEAGGEDDSNTCPAGSYENGGVWYRLGAVDVQATANPTVSLAGAPALVQAGNSYTVTATAADAGADVTGKIQVVEWDADGSAGFERHAVADPDVGVVAADRTQLVTTAVGQCADRTVTVQVTDNGAMSASDAVRKQASTSASTVVNCAPVANDQTVTTTEDAPVAFSVSPTDGDGDTLTYSVTNPADNGTVTGTFPNFAYNPNPSFNGTDSYTYQVSDGQGGSDTATVTFTVNQINDQPVAQDHATSTPEDTTIVIDVDPLISDPDEGDTPPQTLTLSLLAPLVTGASITGPAEITYNPPADFNGVVSIAYEVNDGQGQANSTDQGVIQITVAPVDDPPVAANQSVTTAEDTPIVVLLGPTVDADGESITYTVPTDPDFGSVTVSGTNATYTPDANFYGTDDFVFYANDANNSVAGTITVTVTPVNDAPVADDQSVTTPEDTALPITLTATDVDLPPDVLTFTVIAGPSHGNLDTTSGPNVVYTPDLNYFGPDSLTFQVSDGNGGSDTGTVSITVTPVNDAPVADDLQVDTDEDVPVATLLTASDVDNTQAQLTFTVTVPPTSGTLSGSGANLVYTPNLNFNGSDSFQFQVSDGDLTDEGEVTITVGAVNDPPTAIPQSLSTPEDTALPIVLDAVDPDDDTGDLTFQVIGGPSHGSLSATTGQSTTYTPNLDYNGYDTFVFRVTDPDGLTDLATVVIAVGDPGTNDLPVAEDQTLTTDEDVDLATVLEASDVDGDALTYSIEVPPAFGTASLLNDALIYSPNLNHHGDDFILFKVDDGQGGVAFGSIEITVTSVNDDPDAFPQTVQLVEDTPTAITLDGSDVDGDPLTFSLVSGSGPSHGTLSGTAPNLTYTPSTDYVGNDAFLFSVADGQGGTDTAEVSLVIEEAPKTITTLYAQGVIASIVRRPNLQLLITIPLTAHLNDRATGAPIPGKTIVFTVGNGALHQTCTAVTQADGRATCSVVLSTVGGILSLGYTAYFAGDADNTPSSDGGPLLDVLGLEIP